MTDEDALKLQLQLLEKDLSAVEKELATAEEKSRLYSGGLIRSLIEARIESLKLSKTILEQRVYALKTGAKIVLETKGTKPDPDRAREVYEHLLTLRQELKADKDDAARYSGGLVHAMKQTAIATKEQTLAQLAQEFFVAKYGLALPRIRETQDDSISPSALEEIEEKGSVFEIVEVAGRITESNNSWSKFAWKLTIRNLSPEPIALDAVIEFQDKDGFVVDDDREYGLTVQPHSDQTFTGYALVNAAVVRSVNTISAKAMKRG